jgi:hypothetical protein
MGPSAGLDDVEKRKFLTLREFELRPLGRPARSQSLYRLGYPGVYYETLEKYCIHLFPAQKITAFYCNTYSLMP